MEYSEEDRLKGKEQIVTDKSFSYRQTDKTKKH